MDIKLSFDAFPPTKAETLHHILLDWNPIHVPMILPDG